MIRHIQSYFLFLFLFGLTSISIAQAELNKTDAQGKKQGFWRKNFPDGTPRYEGNFKDDQPEGVFRYYQETGALKMVCYYSDKGRHSHAKGFDPKGFIISDGNYYEQKKDSTWTYYNDQKQVLSREVYKKGSREGTWFIYYPEGPVSEEISYSNDQKNGFWGQ
jgi:antitoxin component YwqK of YwqJK toxin-antitoxin module